MNEARPYASLSSGLLARKGAAKPAMRPQGLGGFEDLGWNDMGSEEYDAPLPEHVPSSIAALTPAPKLRGEEPSVAAQQRAIAESFEGELEEEVEDEVQAKLSAPAPVAPPQPAKAKVVALPPRPAAVPATGRKAAFTLRVDPGRHLRLRLATAVTGRSAQQIVTQALDDYLASFPEIDALAASASGAKRS